MKTSFIRNLLFLAVPLLVLAIGSPVKADILISSNESHSIERFSNDGNWLGTFATTGPRIPYGVAVNPANGDVYVATFTDTVLRYQSNGQPSVNGEAFDVPSEGNPIESLIFDQDGNLWVATYFGESGYVARIYQYSAQELLNKTPQPVDTILTGLRRGNQMAFDQQGNLCIASYFGANVRCFDLTPNHAQTFDYHNELLAAGINPGGFAFDAQNLLYVSGEYSGFVAKEQAAQTGPIVPLAQAQGLTVPILFVTLDSTGLYVPSFHSADSRLAYCILPTQAAAYACNDYDFGPDVVYKVDPNTGAVTNFITNHIWGPYQLVFVDPVDAPQR